MTIFCFVSCNDKKAIYSEKFHAKTSEKFDLKKFNDNKIDSIYEYALQDTIIKLYEGKDLYKKELIYDNHSFKQIFVYDKTTNLLVNQFGHFYGMPVGIWKSYDENGVLISWKNYDENFDFSANELIPMLKKDLQIDLINDTNYQSLLIDRFSYKRLFLFTSYCYAVQINSMGETRTIKIDGKTGEILSDVKDFMLE
ncbi:hypothetical protein [Flavobacterium sp. DG2-3]|uniref:hypothetical protein n=1 Tax=Flavobacterium sp. DG2-3 TaxID=3068317 RepID=UPI00273D5E79|nr:hypothetical protein [Flavobacterium sp. DG2-3]MDP5199036.1 hypothetical protein [Flavobacterium sp. DG2-3]